MSIQDEIAIKRGDALRSNPRSGGGVDRASSYDALGSRFEPHSLYKDDLFSPKPKGSREPGAPLEL